MSKIKANLRDFTTQLISVGRDQERLLQASNKQWIESIADKERVIKALREEMKTMNTERYETITQLQEQIKSLREKNDYQRATILALTNGVAE